MSTLNFDPEINPNNKKFKKVFIEITNTCNLNCTFCPGTKRPQGFMDRTLFEKIITEAKDLAKEAVLHVMGEPLLHPELNYFIEYAHNSGMTVMVTTNGTLLTGKLAKDLARQNLRQINISLHCLNNVTDKIKYLQNILDFSKEFQEHNPAGYINLRLWNILSADNTWIVEQLNNYFQTQIDLPRALAGFKNWKSQPLAENIYLHIDSQFDWPDLANPILQTSGFCYGLNSHFGILVDGTVIPCCLDSAGIINLGNIQNATLAKILNSDRVKNFRKGLQKNNLIEALCQHCGYISRFAGRK